LSGGYIIEDRRRTMTQEIFTSAQVEQFQIMCNNLGYVVWYGSGFRDNMGKILQATEQVHKTKTTDITFCANIRLEDEGRVDTWEQALDLIVMYLKMRR
jgi:hypothetical protein